MGACHLVVSINFRAEACVRDEIRGAVVVIQRARPSFSRDELLRLGAELALQQLREVYNGGRQFRRVTKHLTAGKRPDERS